MADKHLHIMTRASGKLSGDARRLSPRDVTAAFDGSPYGDQPGLKAVIAGKVGRGYAFPPSGEGWVAVTSCSGVSQDDCATVLESLTVGGDIRYAKQAGVL